MTTITDLNVLDVKHSSITIFSYNTRIKNIIARYIHKKNHHKTVTYLEVLKINAHQQYLKDFLVVNSTQTADKVSILSVQYRKTPVFLNMTYLLKKFFKDFLNVAKEVFTPPPHHTTAIDDSNIDIKEWMR